MAAQQEQNASESIRWSWTRHPRCVQLARSQLRKYLANSGDENLVDVGQLLLSELMTNAVKHAHASPGREIRTEFTLTPTHLRVAVSDASDELPLPRQAGAEDENGRGLALVALLSSRWGATPRQVAPHHTIGKTTWFELDRERTPH